MKLFLDACSIIYLLESRQEQGLKTRTIISQALQDETQLIISRLSFLECRILPIKENDNLLLQRYNRFFELPGLQIIELTAEIVEIATNLRAVNSPGLRTPDALQLACALSAGADQFLTGDKKLSAFQGIEVVVV